MNDISFDKAICKLTTMDCIKKITRCGKQTFSLLSANTPSFEPPLNETQCDTDFIEFKRYVTDRMGELDRKIEKYESSLEIKDVVIKLLREELKNTQENLKSVLSENASLIESYTTKNYPKKVINISDHNKGNKANDLDEIIKDIPLDESITSNYNDPLKDFSVNDQLKKIRSRNYNQFLKERAEKRVKTVDVFEDSTLEVKDVTTENSLQKVSKSASKSQNTLKSRNEVVICGDSLLNNIQGNGVSSKSSKAIVRSFPGADTEDMIDYVKPLLIKKKPRFLILHAGTNDITSGCDTTKNLEKIRNLVSEISPSTELVISKLLIREDKFGIKDEVDIKNALLQNFAERYNLYLLDHNNISRKMLSMKKLHLNGTGISCFAQNLKAFITKNC